MINNMIEKRLYDTLGINMIKNKLINDGTEYGINKIKNHFGVEATYRMDKISICIKWLEEFDSNFKNHVANPYIFESNSIFEKPVLISDPFIVKLTKDTFIRVKFNEGGRDVDRNNSGELKLYFFGKKAYRYFYHLQRYVVDNYVAQSLHYSISCNDRDWFVSGSDLIPRSIDSLYFDNDVKYQITSHIDNWLAQKDIYLNKGILYKTGILLYGTPGTGKSSLATAIATYLHCDLVTIDCTKFDKLNVADLKTTIDNDNLMYVVLLDEIDSIFGNRENESLTDKDARVSKLLTFLDGPNSPTNVVFVGTTNYIDKLDKAALRKGRFDLSISLTDIHRPAAVEMCKGFGLDDSKITKILSNQTFPINPSFLQSEILKYL